MEAARPSRRTVRWATCRTAGRGEHYANRVMAGAHDRRIVRRQGKYPNLDNKGADNALSVLEVWR